MLELKNILFPVDFSARAQAAAPAVAAYASRFGAEVTILHVSEEPLLDKRERLDRFADAALPAAQRELRTGKPAAQILQFAKEWHASLIMMVTHGEAGFRQLLLGSVTGSVLHDAESAVWTAAHAESSAPPTTCSSLVCAVDLGPHTVSVLRLAKQMADVWDASMRVVHVVPAIDPRFYSAVAARAHRFLVETAQEQYPALAKQAGLDTPLEVLEEHGIASSIAGECARSNAELLVIGRGAIEGFLGRLRDNAYDIIRASPCPVVSA